MGFFKRLYTGEICPIESVVRDTAEYNDAIHKLNMAADSLERTLSDTQKELLQQLNDAKADIDTLLQAEAYRLGFMNGMEMKQDAGLAALAGMFSSAVSATYGLLNLLCMIAFAYCVIKIFFANIKRGGILLIQIAVGSLYMFSVPRGYTDGFNQWCKQVIAICLTAFMQTTLLFLGLMTFPNNMLLGLGIMLAANEVPRIAQQFGLDSSVRVNMMSVVHATTTAVNLTRSVAKAAGK